MIRPSLNRRLIVLLVAGIVSVWLAAGAWMAWRMLHEVDEIFDQTLVRTAASVFAVMPGTPGAAATSRLPDRKSIGSDTTAHRPAITLRDAHGQLLVQSTEIPALRLRSG